MQSDYLTYKNIVKMQPEFMHLRKSHRIITNFIIKNDSGEMKSIILPSNYHPNGHNAYTVYVELMPCDSDREPELVQFTVKEYLYNLGKGVDCFARGIWVTDISDDDGVENQYLLKDPHPDYQAIFADAVNSLDSEVYYFNDPIHGKLLHR